MKRKRVEKERKSTAPNYSYPQNAELSIRYIENYVEEDVAVSQPGSGNISFMWPEKLCNDTDGLPWVWMLGDTPVHM